MRILPVIFICFTLSSCQTTSIGDNLCSSYKSWAIAPITETQEKRIVYFDWAITVKNHIPFYANMGSPDLDDYDSELYDKVAQLTHYISLDEYASKVASCFGANLNVSRNEGHAGVAQAQYRDRSLSFEWEPKYCRSENPDYSGCFTISSRQNIE